MRSETKLTPAVKSKWRDVRATFASMDRRDYTVRVMAVADNWIMARRPGCIPFVVALRDWHRSFEPAGRQALSDISKGEEKRDG